MLDKLAEINKRFEKLTGELAQPDVSQNQARYRKLTLEHSGLQEIVECYQRYLETQQELEDNHELATASDEDSEIREMATHEIPELSQQL